MAATAALHHAHAGAPEARACSPQSAKPFASGDMACPDPSVHGRDKRLQEQASTAALYVTQPERSANAEQQDPLGPDGKLSSASAATSLKYARAQDLPSFPIVGIDTANSAGSAALLAAGNKTRIEWWKPDGTSDNAAKAALLAKDYKMAPLWKPELSAAGSKAALLAHKDGPKPNLWVPEASADGNSAAGIAMRNKTLSPQTDYGYSDTGKRNALTAATGAVAARNRRRAESSPAPLPNYPDAANSAHNSLNAATIAHRPSVKKPHDASHLNSEAMQSARITHLGANVPKEMFGSTPPVSIEVEEQRRQAALRASAISMAKQMYNTQQHAINEAAGRSSFGETAARGASARPASTASTSPADLKTQALQYMKVQDQAQKLAAERLAKIDADGAGDFRGYYGYNTTKRSRLSIRRGRRRANSDGVMVDSDDEEQSRRIRNQMSIFNTKLAQVDLKKRQQDRESLLAAAERKVQAQMHTMDEKVFMETGKVPPAIMEEWEARARAKAAEQSEKRMENHGKVHVGGGKFLDQSEIDAVAASKVAPTLNEIAEAAEAKRARDEERRLDEEERKRLAAVEREREAERKAEEKRIKSEFKAEEKSRKSHEKAAVKAEKEIEKARRDEEKRLKHDQKHKPKAEEEEHEDHFDAPMTVLEPRPATASTHKDERPAPLATMPSYQAEVEAIGDVASSDEEDTGPRNTIDPEETSHQTRRVATAPTPSAKASDPGSENARSAKDVSFSAPSSPIDHSASSREGGSRGLKSLFSRLKRRSHLGRSKEKPEKDESGSHSIGGGFIGGAALRSQSSLAAPRPQLQQRSHSTNSPVPDRVTPMVMIPPARRFSPSISSLESGEIARTSSGGDLGSSWSSRGRQRSAATGVSSVSNGDDEDEDQFVDAGEALEPPPRLTTKRSTESPQRDSRFMERF
ncbi:eisosome protein 1 protein [Diplodia corticola]|uniref:Eisosome protein 1 protein n=1 Tax=Diplodia corticola TaxID=236234 RepID=A0A1J9RJP8_9PEZI|nr:eisosome protein 1 protein [Diplodia corticola]OJD32795.1 eisosome protein 1 protein [Diplodia corticola]